MTELAFSLYDVGAVGGLLAVPLVGLVALVAFSQAVDIRRLSRWAASAPDTARHSQDQPPGHR